MTPAAMAALHAVAMTTPRPWSAAEFAALLADPATFAVGGAAGFAIGRVVVDEAELLTLAVDLDRRRSGVGRSCLAAYETEARSRGGTVSHLEVAADNGAAIALYESAGYRLTGVRTGYFAHPDGGRVDARLYRKELAGN